MSTTRARSDVTLDDPIHNEWMKDVNLFIDDLLGSPDAPAAVSQFSVFGNSNGVVGEFRALNIKGVTEYAIYRSTTQEFDLNGPTSLIDTILQPPDPTADIVTFTDSEGDDSHYYFVRAIKGNWSPKIVGARTQPKNTLDQVGFDVAPGRVTNVGLSIVEVTDAQGINRASLSFSFTKPNPLGTYQFTEIWMVNYQGGYKPVLAFESEESGFIRTLNMTEERIGFLYVAANRHVRRRVILKEGTFRGANGTTTKLKDPNGNFIQRKIRAGSSTVGSATVGTGDLVVNTTNGALFSITSVDSETELTIVYEVNSPTVGADGDFDDGDGYLILQGPYVVDTLSSTNNDSAVPSTAQITVDADLLSVDLENALNDVLVNAAATSQQDTADEMIIQIQPEGSSAFSTSGGFAAPTINRGGGGANAHPNVTAPGTGVVQHAESMIVTLSVRYNWEITAAVHNHFGWSDFTNVIVYTPSLNPDDAEDNIPDLASFGVWTKDNPPTPSDPKITGLTVRFDVGLADDDNLTTFMVAVEGNFNTPNPEDWPVPTVRVDQSTATATCTRGTSTIRLTGAGVSGVTLDQYAGDVFWFGAHGVDNYVNGDALDVWNISGNTAEAGSGFIIVTVSRGQGNYIVNNGTITNWSVEDFGIWEIVDFYTQLLVDSPKSGAKQINAAIIDLPQHYQEMDIPAGLYFRARAFNVRGSGSYRYADGTDTGTTVASSASLKRTAGLTASEVSKGVVPHTVNLTFTPDVTNPHRRVTTGAGTISYADGTTESINAFDSGLLAPSTLYYLFKIHGNADLQTSVTFSDAIGDDRSYLGQLVTHSTSDETLTVFVFGALGGPIFTAATAVIGKLSALSVDAGELTAGTITGLLFRTSASGKRIEISSADTFDFYDSGGTKVFDLDVDASGHSALVTYSNKNLSLLADGQLVLRSGGGQVLIGGVGDSDVFITAGNIAGGGAANDQVFIRQGTTVIWETKTIATAGWLSRQPGDMLGNDLNMGGGDLLDANVVATDKLDKQGGGTLIIEANQVDFNNDAGGGGPLFRVLNGVGVGVTGDVIVNSGGDVTVNGGDVTTNGDVRSQNDGSDNCGTVGNRWADVRSVLINGADICLANRWRLRELGVTDQDMGYERVGKELKKSGNAPASDWFHDKNQGIVVMDDEGEVTAIFHKNGDLYLKGEVRSLNDRRED